MTIGTRLQRVARKGNLRTADLARWFDVPITLSLAIMGAILTLCAVLSWIAGNTKPNSENGKHQPHSTD